MRHGGQALTRATCGMEGGCQEREGLSGARPLSWDFIPVGPTLQGMSVLSQGLTGIPGLTFTHLPSPGWGLGASIFRALPPGGSDAHQDWKLSFLRVAPSLSLRDEGGWPHLREWATSSRSHSKKHQSRVHIFTARAGGAWGALERALLAFSPPPALSQACSGCSGQLGDRGEGLASRAQRIGCWGSSPPSTTYYWASGSLALKWE